MKHNNTNTPLTLLQLEEACSKSIRNAIELLDEAEILYEHNRYARSLFLLRISNEELGKFFIIIETMIMVISNQEIDWKKFWKRLNKHEEKTYSSEHIISGLIEEKLYMNPKDDIPKTILFWEYLKLSSLYVDFVDNSFRLPSDFISPELTDTDLKLMRNRLMSLVLFDVKEFTSSEIEKASQ